MISFLEQPTVAATGVSCEIAGLENIMHYAVIVINVIQIVVPIALIIFGSIDLLKGIIAGDEKKISAARKPFIQRLISAILVFLIPFIVNFAINTFVSDATAWKSCYRAARTATAGTKVNSQRPEELPNAK